MKTTLNFLSAGAAQGLINDLQGAMTDNTGATLEGRFGAVGAMKEAFDAGEPCDLIVLTAKMIDDMAAASQVWSGSMASLGKVYTGVAVRYGDGEPDVSTPDALREALRMADEIFFPDPQRATAGIHFASVLRQLGVHDELAPRFRTFPNGATAMRELAAATTPRPIGCTQVTEIRYTPGVHHVALLPREFELATVYSAAVTQRAAQPELARRFIAMLTDLSHAQQRQQAGFEA